MRFSPFTNFMFLRSTPPRVHPPHLPNAPLAIYFRSLDRHPRSSPRSPPRSSPCILHSCPSHEPLSPYPQQGPSIPPSIPPSSRPRAQTKRQKSSQQMTTRHHSDPPLTARARDSACLLALPARFARSPATAHQTRIAQRHPRSFQKHRGKTPHTSHSVTPPPSPFSNL